MSDVRYGALLGNGSTSSQQDLDWRSRMHLVQILEHSFKHIFTPGCSTKSTIDISTLATKLLVDFQRWRDISHKQPTSKHGPEDDKQRQYVTDLIILYHFLRVMLLLSIPRSQDPFSQKALDASRDQIKTFFHSCKADADLSLQSIARPAGYTRSCHRACGRPENGVSFLGECVVEE